MRYRCKSAYPVNGSLHTLSTYDYSLPFSVLPLRERDILYDPEHRFFDIDERYERNLVIALNYTRLEIGKFCLKRLNTLRFR